MFFCCILDFFSFQKPSLSSVHVNSFNILYHMSLKLVATFLCITCGVWSKSSGNWPLKIKAVATLNGDPKDWSEASLKSFMLLFFSLLLFLLGFFLSLKRRFSELSNHTSALYKCCNNTFFHVRNHIHVYMVIFFVIHCCHQI